MNQQVADSYNGTEINRTTEGRTVVFVILGAAVLASVTWLLDAISFLNESYPVFVLIGPILTGIVAGATGRSWRPFAAAWALSGLAILVYDWIANGEDQLFHAIVSLVTAGLVWVGHAPSAAIARHLRDRR